MIDWLMNLRATGPLVLLLYWLPLLLCAYGYLLRTAKDYRKERTERDTLEYFVPKLTVGTLIGRAVATIVPVANLVAAVFDVAPEVFGQFFRWISKAVNIPLVPKRKR